MMWIVWVVLVLVMLRAVQRAWRVWRGRVSAAVGRGGQHEGEEGGASLGTLLDGRGCVAEGCLVALEATVRSSWWSPGSCQGH